MSWTEIVIEVARDHAEALSDALIEAGALSVSVEDADEGTEQEQPLFGEPGMEPKQAAWEHSRVVALTDVDADQAAIVAEAKASQSASTFEVHNSSGTARFLTNSAGDPVIPSYSNSTRPTAATAGRLIYNTDDANLNIDTGSGWILPDGTNHDGVCLAEKQFESG